MTPDEPTPQAKPARPVPGELKVRLWVSPLAIFFRACTPVIEIDGHQHPSRWGTHAFDVSPGRVRVRVWIPYVTSPMCGLNEIEVQIRSSKKTRVQFLMPPWMFKAGQLVEVERFTV